MISYILRLFVPFVAVVEIAVSGAAGADSLLLGNGSFEVDADADGWPDQWEHPKAGAAWIAEGGQHFLRLSAGEPGKLVMLYRRIDLPKGTRALELRWRQRVTDLKTGKEPWFDARIMLEFKDAAGGRAAQHPSPPYTQKSTAGWEPRSTQFLVPEGAALLELMPALFQVEKGVFDLDDVALKTIPAEPLLAAARAAQEAERRMVVPAETPQPAKWPPELHVEGRRVLNSANREVWLQGVNAGGLETLAQDAHVRKSAQVAVDEWKANIVRLPVQEEFWFGRSAQQKDGGKAYREAIDGIVTLVANRGAYLLLDLHRFRAPRAEHLEFWKDAAAHFANHPAVLFDLFNEPHNISWEVWRDGGFVAEKKAGLDESAFLSEEDKIKNHAGFRSVGMQALLDAVRGAGAKNIVVAGGLGWSSELAGVTQGFALTDQSGRGVIYGWHIYNWHNDWAGKVLAAAEKFPILVGEFGADVKKLDFIPAAAQENPYTWVPDMLGFIQKNHLHWTGWCLHPQASPVMISDWNYTPTPFWGAFAKRALSGERFEMKKMR